MRLETFDVLDSTNTYAKTHRLELDHGTIIRARYQTSGRGQFRRKWESAPNENILFSMVFHTSVCSIDPSSLERIFIQTMLIFLRSFGLQPTHKLPNDILVNGKKICGMLLETHYEGSSLSSLIMGVGLNLNQRQFMNLPDATSLARLTNQTYDIDSTFLSLIDQLLGTLRAENMLK